MSDDTKMTISVNGGPESAPFTMKDLEGASAALASVTKRDSLHSDAARFLAEKGAASTSLVQRKFGISHTRATSLMEGLERAGMVVPPDANGKWVWRQTRLEDDGVAHREKKYRRDPMKNTAEDDSVIEQQSNAAGEELRQFIERVEHLEAEKKDIAEGIKEVMSEAKNRGYTPKIIRKVIALRKRDPDDIAEEEAVLDMYKAALGMS